MSNWYDVIFLSLIWLLTIGLRVITRLLCPRMRGADTYTHLALADLIRKNHLRVPYRNETFVLEKVWRYPWFFHQFLALFPRRMLERTEGYISAFVDAAHVTIVYSFAKWVAALPELVSYRLDPICVAVVSGLTFAVTPALIVLGVGPRVSEATPRPFGELLFTLSLVSGLFYAYSGTIWAAMASMFFVGLMLLSSKFAAQAFIVTCFLLALWSQDFFFLILILLGAAAAFILSWGRYRDIFYGQIQHLWFYQNRMASLHPILQRRNSLRELMVLPRLIFTNPGQATQTLLYNNTIILTILRNPFLVVLALILLSVETWSLRTILIRFLLGWVISALVAFLATSLRPLFFLGEAERYVEYAIPAISILVALGLNVAHSALLGLTWILAIVWSLAVIIFHYWIDTRSYKARRRGMPSEDELVEWLRNLEYRQTILLVPMFTMMRVRLPYETNHQLLDFGNDFGMHRISEIDVLCDPSHFFWPRANLQDLTKKHGVTLVIVQPNKLKADIRETAYYDFSGFCKIFENQSYIVYSTQGDVEIASR